MVGGGGWWNWNGVIMRYERSDHGQTKDFGAPHLRFGGKRFEIEF